MGHNEAKVTIMVLKVELDCQKCYKKVKKVICKLPQIRDQKFDEKQNTVTIRVVCCSPEKIRDKLCCKGGKSIKSIEVKEPEKPKESAVKPTEAAKKPKHVTFAELPKDSVKKKESEMAREAEKPKTSAAPEPVKVVAPQVNVQEYQPMYPFSTCYDACKSGCPRYQMHGGLQQPQFVLYDCYYGRPVYDSWAGGYNNYNHRCNEDNPACTIM